VLNYCHTDPLFLSINLPYGCSGDSIARITSASHPTYRIIDSFLHDTDVNLPYPCTWLGAGGDTGDPASPAVIEFGRFAVEGFDLGSQWYVIFVIKGLAFPAVYSLFSFPGPAGAGNDPRPFRCLNPNTFWLADSGDLVGLGGSQILPSSIIVQPFWP
jgi:hypothetical protein